MACMGPEPATKEEIDAVVTVVEQKLTEMGYGGTPVSLMNADKYQAEYEEYIFLLRSTIEQMITLHRFANF